MQIHKDYMERFSKAYGYTQSGSYAASLRQPLKNGTTEKGMIFAFYYTCVDLK